MKKYIWILGFLLSVVGCRTIEQTTDHTHQKDSVRVEYITKLDSIYLWEKDSIFIKEKGDTIFVDKWHLRYKDKIVLQHDSIYIDKIVTDSVSVTKVEQVRYVPTFYKTCTWLWWILVVAVVLYIAWRLFKKFYLRK